MVGPGLCDWGFTKNFPGGKKPFNFHVILMTILGVRPKRPNSIYQQ